MNSCCDEQQLSLTAHAPVLLWVVDSSMGQCWLHEFADFRDRPFIMMFFVTTVHVCQKAGPSWGRTVAVSCPSAYCPVQGCTTQNIL